MTKLLMISIRSNSKGIKNRLFITTIVCILLRSCKVENILPCEFRLQMPSQFTFRTFHVFTCFFLNVLKEPSVSDSLIGLQHVQCSRDLIVYVTMYTVSKAWIAANYCCFVFDSFCFSSLSSSSIFISLFINNYLSSSNFFISMYLCCSNFGSFSNHSCSPPDLPTI